MVLALTCLSVCAFAQDEEDVNKAVKNDPAWKTTHHETSVLKVGTPGAVNNFCLNTDGNLLVCVGGDRVEYAYDPKTKKTKSTVIKAIGKIDVFSPTGQKLKSWPVPIKPGAICVQKDGSIFVGGDGKVLKLNSSGKIVSKTNLPGEMPKKPELGRELREVTGIAITGNDLFVATQSLKDYGYVVYRLTPELKVPKQVVSDLSGCCGQMDIQAHNGDLWVAHNARHLVERYSRTGKKLSSFGKFDRKAASGFGGCCEPKNLRFAENVVYCAESGPPTCIKKFSLSGKFLGVVAVPEFKTGCVRVTTEVSKDGKFYMLDPDGGQIHVIGKA